MEDVKYVDCNICGSKSYNLLFVGRDRIHRLEGEFKIVQCRKCGLVFVNPRPTPKALKKFYPENSYYAYSLQSKSPTSLKELVRWVLLKEYFDYPLSPQHTSQFFSISKSIAKILATLSRKQLPRTIPYQQDGRLLDVGCGSGEYLHLMKRLGWKVYGVEPSHEAVKYAREKFDLENITEGALEDCNFTNEYFDLITLWHVLEHLPDPKETLQKIHQLLKPTGTLIIGLPNADSIEAKIFKGMWSGIDVPRHLYDFSPITLRKMLEKTGFRPIKLNFCSTYLTFTGSLKMLFDEKINNRKTRQALNWLADSRLLLPLKLYCYITDRFKVGSCFEMYAKKRFRPSERKDATFNHHC